MTRPFALVACALALGACRHDAHAAPDATAPSPVTTTYDAAIVTPMDVAIAMVTIAFETDPPGATVSIDGVPLPGVTPLPPVAFPRSDRAVELHIERRGDRPIDEHLVLRASGTIHRVLHTGVHRGGR